MEHRKGRPLYKNGLHPQKCTQRAFCSGRFVNLRGQSHHAPLHPKVQHPLCKREFAHAAGVARYGCKSQKSGNMQDCTCKGQQRAKPRRSWDAHAGRKTAKTLAQFFCKPTVDQKEITTTELESPCQASTGQTPTTTTIMPTLSVPAPGMQGASSGRCVPKPNLACQLASPTSSW